MYEDSHWLVSRTSLKFIISTLTLLTPVAHPLIGRTREVTLQLNLLTLGLPIHHFLPILRTEFIIVLFGDFLQRELLSMEALPEILILDI